MAVLETRIGRQPRLGAGLAADTGRLQGTEPPSASDIGILHHSRIHAGAYDGFHF